LPDISYTFDGRPTWPAIAGFHGAEIMDIRLGCDLPFFASPSEIRDFAQAAEDLGYDCLNFSEHVAATRDTPFPPGFSFEDPWHESMTLAAFLAAVTSRIEISTSMMLLPLRPTVLAAKQSAEVDQLAQGRLRLGVAAGWNEREVALLGQDPASRGSRLEEQIEVMRLLWTQPSVTYSGAFHEITDAGIHPRPERSIPIWMGAGNLRNGGVPGDRLIRRIVRYADGYKMFAPLGLDREAAVHTVERLRAVAREEGRDPGSLGIEARLLPQVVPEQQWRPLVADWAALEADYVGLGNRIVGGSVEDQITLVSRVIEIVRK
jgi:probable F420-dependent oxidoreductase